MFESIPIQIIPQDLSLLMRLILEMYPRDVRQVPKRGTQERYPREVPKRGTQERYLCQDTYPCIYTARHKRTCTSRSWSPQAPRRREVPILRIYTHTYKYQKMKKGLPEDLGLFRSLIVEMYPKDLPQAFRVGSCLYHIPLVQDLVTQARF